MLVPEFGGRSQLRARLPGGMIRGPCEHCFIGLLEGVRIQMPPTWTAEQVIALSPDASSTKNGKKLASASHWVTLGRGDRAIWGECKGSGSKPYRTQIDLSEPAFKCSCPSRKFPCKHGLGLFLLFAEQPTLLGESAPPDWVEEWLQQRESREQVKATKKAKAADPAAQAKRTEKREAKVRAGIQELGLWSQDLIRQGLAAVQSQSYEFWETPAARMVDAQASGLARQVRDLAGIPYMGKDWPDRMLARLGRIHLLLEGYQRLETLPKGTQADIRALIGWTQNQEELLAAKPGEAERLRDRWFVLGKRIEEEERLRTQRVWLWGEASQRPALVLSFAVNNQPLDISLVPGTILDAELTFFPSGYPLRALVKERYAAPEPIATAIGFPDLQAAIGAWAQAIARQPWLGRFPFPLRDVTLLHDGGQWWLQDMTGAGLAIAADCGRIWEFFAVAGGHPMGLFGEWDGEQFLPLSSVAAGQFWDGGTLQ